MILRHFMRLRLSPAEISRRVERLGRPGRSSEYIEEYIEALEMIRADMEAVENRCDALWDRLEDAGHHALAARVLATSKAMAVEIEEIDRDIRRWSDAAAAAYSREQDALIAESYR